MQPINKLILCLLFVSLFLPISNSYAVQPIHESKFYGDKFYRTELYFGLGKNDGTEVSDEEWSTFLDREVTPRFPDGFTALDARGHYRISSGKIIRERSRILILLYPKRLRDEASKKIDEIREAYKRTFHQESVLRVTGRQSTSVDF